MILTLYTEAHFSAAHCLEDYKGKCSRFHGHTWKVAIWVQGDECLKQPNGILWDFGNIKRVIRQLDHTNLNEILQVNPTAENIALYIYHFFKTEKPDLAFLVRIYENPVQPRSFCQVGDFTHA